MRSVGCSREGHVLAVVDLEQGAGPVGDPPWRAPAQGPFAYGLVSVVDDERVELIGTVPHEASSAIAANLCVSESGRFVGPHVDGAALYEPDGSVVRAFAAARTEHSPPVAAISASGRWVAVTHEGGAIQLLDLVEQVDRVLPGSFSEVHSVRVADDGQVLVGGFIYPSWGVYRVAPDAQPVRLFESMGATLAPEGDAAVTVSMDRVRKIDLFPASEEWPATRIEGVFPALCGGKSGAVHLLDGSRVLIATRGHTLACIDLAKLG